MFAQKLTCKTQRFFFARLLYLQENKPTECHCWSSIVPCEAQRSKSFSLTFHQGIKGSWFTVILWQLQSKLSFPLVIKIRDYIHKKSKFVILVNVATLSPRLGNTPLFTRTLYYGTKSCFNYRWKIRRHKCSDEKQSSWIFKT